MVNYRKFKIPKKNSLGIGVKIEAASTPKVEIVSNQLTLSGDAVVTFTIIDASETFELQNRMKIEAVPTFLFRTDHEDVRFWPVSCADVYRTTGCHN